MKKFIEKIGQPVHIIIIKVVLSILLIVAIFDQPYGYYEFLRWIVCAYMFFQFFKFFDDKGPKEPDLIIAFSLCMALVYNPIFPFYFSKFAWQLIDISVILFIVLSVLANYEWEKENK